MKLTVTVTMLIASTALTFPGLGADPLPRAPGRPVHVPPPAAPGTTAQPFSGGVIVREPGKPPQLVIPKKPADPGQADIRCQKVGEGTYRCQ